MAVCPELQRGAKNHPQARHSGWLNKRVAGSWIGSWHQRWCSCEGNFLFTHSTPDDTGVGKLVLLDGCTIDTNPDVKGSKDFAFSVKTRTGRILTFACEKELDKARWVSVLEAAAYDKMMQRSYAAKRFLDTCIALMQPAVDAQHESDAVETSDVRGASSTPQRKGAASQSIAEESQHDQLQVSSPPPPVNGEPPMLDSVLTAQHVADAIVALRLQRGFLRSECRRLADRLKSRGGPGSGVPSPQDRGGAVEADARRDRAARRNAQELSEVKDQLARVRQEMAGTKTRLADAESEVDKQRTRAAVAESRLNEHGSGKKDSGISGTRSESTRGEGDGGHSGGLDGVGSSGSSDDRSRTGAGASLASGTSAVVVASLRAEKEAQGRQIGRLRAEVEELQARVAEMEAGLEREREQRRGAQQATDAAEAKAAGLRARAKAAERELEVARGEVSRLSHEIEMAARNKGKGAGAGAFSSPHSPDAGTAGPRRHGLVQDGKSAEEVDGSPSRIEAGPGAGPEAEEDDQDQVKDDDEDSSWAPFFREAQLLEGAGRYADAQRQYEAVLRAREEQSVDRGQDGRGADVAAALRDLGRVLALQQQFSASEGRYQDAVDQCKAFLGASHASTACALTDLAAVQREQGKFELAESNASEAVDALRTSMGRDDVSTATALYNLAGLRRRQGKFDKASEAYLDALRVYERRIESGTSTAAGGGVGGQGEAADTLYQLGTLERRRGDWKEAGGYFNRAADAYAKAYGPRDRRVEEATRRARDMAQLMGERPGTRGGKPSAGVAVAASGTGKTGAGRASGRSDSKARGANGSGRSDSKARGANGSGRSDSKARGANGSGRHATESNATSREKRGHRGEMRAERDNAAVGAKSKARR